MKKKFTHVAKTIFTLLVFLFIQLTSLAVDTGAATTMDTSGSIFSKPWIWIGMGVIVVIKLLGPFTSDDKFVIVRKKQARKVKV